MNLNFKKFVEVLENAPEEVKNTFMSMMFSMGMSMKQLEEHTLKEKNVGIEQSINGGGSLSESFINGKHSKQTQEYKERFYSILREADKIAEEKFGNTYFSSNMDLLTEMGGDASIFNKRKEVLNEKYNNGLSIIIENKVTLLNQDYMITRSKPIYKSAINILKTTDVIDESDVDCNLTYLEIYNKYGNNVQVKLIFQNYDQYQFNTFSNFYQKYRNLIINKSYAIEFYKNYKKEYLALENLINEDINQNSIILTFNGKFVR